MVPISFTGTAEVGGGSTEPSSGTCVATVAVERRLLAVTIEKVGADRQRGLGRRTGGQVRVDVAVVDVAALVLRVGVAVEVRVQEGADVGNVGVGDTRPSVSHVPQRSRPRVADHEVVLVLVDPGVGGIEVGVDRRQRRRARSQRG